MCLSFNQRCIKCNCYRWDLYQFHPIPSSAMDITTMQKSPSLLPSKTCREIDLNHPSDFSFSTCRLLVHQIFGELENQDLADILSWSRSGEDRESAEINGFQGFHNRMFNPRPCDNESVNIITSNWTLSKFHLPAMAWTLRIQTADPSAKNALQIAVNHRGNCCFLAFTFCIETQHEFLGWGNADSFTIRQRQRTTLTASNWSSRFPSFQC